MTLENNSYSVQGIKLTELAKEYGTPLYVYDAQIIEGQVNKLKNAFSGLKLKLKYAAKALTNISVLKLIQKLGCDVDTVSLEEIHIALKAGFSPSQITFTPNSVPFSEIVTAVEMGVFVNIDNLSILEDFGKKYGSNIPCSIRINPHIMAGGHEKISVGHKESKFGISIDYLPEILKIHQQYNINISGLHVHTGSDFSDIDVFMQSAELMFSAAQEFKTIKIVDFGSGFKVAYKHGDKNTDVDLLGKKMLEATKKFAKQYGSEPEIWFEPGKFIVSDSGLLLVNVNVMKQAHEVAFAGVDSGLNHLVRPMMYGSYHEIVNISNPNGTKKEYSVVGYICETDTFAWKRKISETKTGDTLAILNAGAYGYSMSSQYNSRPRPAEVMIVNGKAHLIRKRETLEDILRGQVEISL
jgi:diaminopimelate decarboxylase